MTCAVGPNILKFIAPVIAKAIDARTASTPLAVIACENAIGATDTLAGFIKDPKHTAPERVASIGARARFANSAIDRIVPGQDPDAGLDVKIESFFEWAVDETPWKPDQKHPQIEGVHWVTDLTPYIERKLFTVNTSHATAAYFGCHKHIKTIHESMADPEINKQVRGAVEETSALIVAKHGIPAAEQTTYREQIITRISNPALGDAVERVGRAPLRKLSRKERFIGPAAELAERGLSVAHLLGSVEMAFRFQNVQGDDESKELASIVKEHTPEQIVEKVCGLTAKDALYTQVLKVVEKIKA